MGTPSKSPKAPHHQLGDALSGNVISVKARKIDKPRYGEGSHRDRIQFTTLRGSAYCVIDIPVKWFMDKKL